MVIWEKPFVVHLNLKISQKRNKKRMGEIVYYFGGLPLLFEGKYFEKTPRAKFMSQFQNVGTIYVCMDLCYF